MYALKLAVPFEVRIFLIVVLVGIISVLVILDSPVPAAPQVIDARVVQGLQQPGEPSNTLVISGIDIGQSIGFKSPSISGNEFACFADRNIQTDRGRATMRQYLLLRDPTVGGFNGCSVVFAESDQDKTGIFMRCLSSEDMFSFLMEFDPSLDSDIEDGELEDILEETLPIFGMGYTIVRADVKGDRLELRLIGPAGSIDFSDDYTDNSFSDDVAANGKQIMEGRIRVRGFSSGDEFRIQSIEYRLRPLASVGKDIYVGDHQGTKQHLRTPEGFFGDFDILFAGVGNAPPKVSAPAPKPKKSSGSSMGGAFAFDAAGDDQYYMIFTNARGQRYKFPIVALDGGALRWGDEDQDFLFTGAGAGPAFNIDLHDLFAVTNRQDPQGVTNIVEYSSVDFDQGKAYFNDLAGGNTVGMFDMATGDGTVVLGGNSYAFRVDTADPHSMTIDQNGDGTLGGEAEIVVAGGMRVDLAAGFTGKVEIDPRLYTDEAPAGGETINFAFMEDDGDVNIDVTSGVTLIKDDSSRMKLGMTQFGMGVALDDRRDTARDLFFGASGAAFSQSPPQHSSAGGQSQANVLITCERSEFVKKAQAAKKK